MGLTIGLAIIEAIAVVAPEIAAIAAPYAPVIGNVVLAATAIGVSLALQPGIPPVAAGHQTAKQTIPPRIWLCDRARIAGAYMLYVGADGNSYDVIAMCGGPVSRIVQYYLNDDIIEFQSGQDPFTTTNGAFVKDDPSLLDGRYTADSINIEVRKGLPTETAYASVYSLPKLSGLWTVNHRGDGIHSARMLCRGVKQEDLQKIYPSILPKYSEVPIGPPLWDFTDPGQDPDDSSTWTDYPAWVIGTTYAAGARVNYLGVAYKSAVASNTGNNPETSLGKWLRPSRNPVLRLVDYLIDPDHGIGLPRATLIDPVIARLTVEVNHCDELVERADLDFEPRYGCAGWYTYDTDPQKVIGAIMASCDGWVTTDSDGTLALIVGVYRDDGGPILQDRHIVGISLETGIEDEEQVNSLDITFTSPEHKYKQIAAKPWRDEADITFRGITRSQPLPLDWVQTHRQARALGKRAMARIEANLRGTCVATLYGLAITGRRWVRMQYSEVTQLADCWVEVQRVETDFLAGTVTFDWVLIDPATIDVFVAATEEGDLPFVAADVGAETLPIPQHVTVASVGGTGSGTQIRIRFDDPGRTDVTFVIRYRLADDGSGSPGPWITERALTPSTDGTTVTIVTTLVASFAGYVVEVASSNARGTLSDWSNPVSVTATGDGIVDNTGGDILDNTGQRILEHA